MSEFLLLHLLKPNWLRPNHSWWNIRRLQPKTFCARSWLHNDYFSCSSPCSSEFYHVQSITDGLASWQDNAADVDFSNRLRVCFPLLLRLRSNFRIQTYLAKWRLTVLHMFGYLLCRVTRFSALNRHHSKCEQMDIFFAENPSFCKNRERKCIAKSYIGLLKPDRLYPIRRRAMQKIIKFRR